MTYRYGANERFDHPLAVVIGAGGIGMAVARRLAQQHRILLADIDFAKVSEMAGHLRAEGGHCDGIGCDVTDPDSVRSLARAVRQRGSFRALVHVTGLSPSAGDFSRIVRVNLMGPALVADALRPLAGIGTAAVFVSSLAAHILGKVDGIDDLLDRPTAPDLPELLTSRLGSAATSEMAYGLTKKALNAIVRRSAPAWGELGARILTVSPGMIATPMGAVEFEKSEAKRQLFARTPLSREGTMHEIADAIEFLVSSRASFISGTDLLVDGGLAAAVTG